MVANGFSVSKNQTKLLLASMLGQTRGGDYIWAKYESHFVVDSPGREFFEREKPGDRSLLHSLVREGSLWVVTFSS
jgi:hypothetical protein